MALVIDTTLEGVSANSYSDVAEADAYHEARLHNSLWTSITDVEIKKAALIWATRVLDSYMSWKGNKKTNTQSLGWPRLYAYDADGNILGYDYTISSYVIARELKNATAELAFLLIESDTVSESTDNALSGLKVDVITLDFETNEGSMPDTIPSSVVGMLRSYGSFLKNSAASVVVPLVRVY